MRFLPILILACLLAVSCAKPPTLTPEQQASTDKAMQHPLTFAVPYAEAANAWGRANAWLAQYASMKLQVVTDYALQTYPPHEIMQYGYHVTRAPIDGGFSFTIECRPFSGNLFWNGDDEANHNAHILALYTATGELNSIVY